MKRNPPEKQNKRRAPITWLLLVLLLASLSIGGVSAYLSMTSNTDSASLTTADPPTVTVSGTSVSVTPNGYAVYLRVAVDASLQKDGMIMPLEPDNAYTLNVGWKEIKGYYYYTSPIFKAETLYPIALTDTVYDDGTPVINIAAQVIQAAGKTDDGLQSAVEAAWHVTPSDIEG